MLGSQQSAAEAIAKSLRNGVLTYKNNYAEAYEKRIVEMWYIMDMCTLLPIEAETLLDCQHEVDTWIAERWHKPRASDSKLQFLRKLGYDHDALSDEAEVGNDPAAWRERNLRQLNKGQAANMITRLVHGVGKRWEESRKFKVKRAKALAREIGVDIGPIPKVVEV
ncbi:hypothetical protein BGZ94_009005 [Podila epigama]|nr:hypothetical protein BGZ94_009005 [Podila epigama]